MDVNAGCFDEPEHILIEFQRLVRVQSSLQKDLGSTNGLGFQDFFRQLFPAEYLAVGISGGLEKGTEFTGGNADVGIIDIAVDDVGHHWFGMHPATYTVGEKTQLVEACLVFKP